MRLSIPFPLASLFVLSLLLLTACGGSGPAKTVEDFHDRLDRGDVDGAIGLLSNEVVEVLGEGKLRLGLRHTAEEIRAKGGIRSLRTIEEDVGRDLASVRVEVEYGNGVREADTVQLVRENGEWRLAPSK